MIHEPECAWAGQPDDDKCPTCNLLRMGYQRGREDALKPVRELADKFEREGIHYRLAAARVYGAIGAAARGAEPHQGDTDQHPDSQRFRYGFGNSIPTVENTILDDSDDEKVVIGNYVDNVTGDTPHDAGDTPQPTTNWVRSLLQSGEVDTPDTEQSEPINAVVKTISPASTLQNRQAATTWVDTTLQSAEEDDAAPGGERE